MAFSLSYFSTRTSPPQRTRAPGTASRPWPPSCPLYPGSRRTEWSCTIRTGTRPPPTHPIRLRETSRLKCEDADDTHSNTNMLTSRHRGTQRDWTSAKLYISDFPRRSHTHTAPRLLQCALLDPILYLFTAAEDRHEKKTVLLYIFRKDYWKRTGAWHVWDWQHFFKWT